MDRLIAIEAPGDVPAPYDGTPVARLLAHHNLGVPPGACDAPRLLVGTCMDHRVGLRMPRGYAYVLRTGGADLRRHDFEVSFALAVGGVRAVAVIGHSDCGMARVTASRDAFVEGLEEAAGWDAEEAGQHFRRNATERQIGDPVDFALSEARRLRRRYPGIPVAPLHYRVEDRRLYVVEE